MKKIVIGFSRPKSRFAVFSLLIRMFDKFNCSHTYVEFNDKKRNIDLIYHAKGTNIHFVKKEIFDDYNTSVYRFEIEVNDEQMNHIVGYLLHNAGKPYSMMQIFGIALAILVKKLTKINIPNILSQGKSSMVCSELVAHILTILNIKVNYNLDTVTPKEVYGVCKEQLKEI